jgi:hypothetical protein
MHPATMKATAAGQYARPARNSASTLSKVVEKKQSENRHVVIALSIASSIVRMNRMLSTI